VTIWGVVTVFTPNEHSFAIIIPKELALTKRIVGGNKIRVMTRPDGSIVIEKVERLETK